MPPRFIFVRHGEATHNVAFHQEGESAFEDVRWKDAELTEKGKEQAKKVGEELASYKIKDIWCSPLTRCIQTAEEIFEETSCEDLYLHDNLLERQGGNHVCNERKLKSEIKKLHSIWDVTHLPDIPMYWGPREHQMALYSRMLSFVLLLAHIYNECDDNTHIVIVSHNDAIHALTKKSLKNCETIICSLEEILKD